MHLFFINGSMQKKHLVESDYAEDIIDVIIEFFETHNRFPHMMNLVHVGNDIKLTMSNTGEHFLIEECTSDDATIINDWINKEK